MTRAAPLRSIPGLSQAKPPVRKAPSGRSGGRGGGQGGRGGRGGRAGGGSRTQKSKGMGMGLASRNGMSIMEDDLASYHDYDDHDGYSSDEGEGEDDGWSAPVAPSRRANCLPAAGSSAAAGPRPKQQPVVVQPPTKKTNHVEDPAAHINPYEERYLGMICEILPTPDSFLWDVFFGTLELGIPEEDAFLTGLEASLQELNAASSDEDPVWEPYEPDDAEEGLRGAPSASSAGGGFWGGDRPDERSAAAAAPASLVSEELQLIHMGFRLPDIQRTLKQVSESCHTAARRGNLLP